MSVRVGLIGAGMIAQMTGREFASNPDAELVAIADPSKERAAALAKMYGIENVLDDGHALLSRDDIDAVYIAVPNCFHAAYAIAALDAGKHTLLEKPFAMNLAEAQSVADAAARSNAKFMVGMNQRFGANAQAARSMVARGDIGEVFHVKAFWRRRAGIPRIGSWFTHQETAGGGGLLDIGVHMLDVGLWCIDNFEPTNVLGTAHTQFGNRGIGDGRWGRSERTDNRFDVDDFATALIQLEGGATVQLEAAWAIHQENANDMNVVLYGSEGTLNAYESKLYRAGEDGYEVIQNPKAPEPIYPHQSRVDNFVNAIEGREELCVSIEQSLAVQRILDGIYGEWT